MVTSLKSLFATTEIGIDEFGEEKISKIVDCGFILDVEGPLLLLLFDNMVKSVQVKLLVNEPICILRYEITNMEFYQHH